MSSFTGKNLTCIRGDRVMFSRLNFSVKKGEVLFIKGANGSGKTTLLRLMASLMRPTSGSISWNNLDIMDNLSFFRGLLHYVGHHDGIKMALTVEENLCFWARINNIGSEEKFVKEALKKFSLLHISNLPSRFLSMGQRKRLNLARICTSSAPLWLLDEPLSSLDADASQTVRNVISTHQDKGGMAVITSHDEPGLDNKVLNLSSFTNDPEARSNL